MNASTEQKDIIQSYAPAKLNLYLDVLKKREDGYHDIVTVMQAINLGDELTFQLRDDDRIKLHTEGSHRLPPTEENLVVRAARLLQRNTGMRKGADIQLAKQIPVGGGLGGGSSDCACTLKTLNRLWRCHLSDKRLMTLAAELGSDVPFFIRGGTALCRGRGECITPIKNPKAFNYAIVIPNLAISTARVYSAVSYCLTKITPVVSIGQVHDALVSGNASKLGAVLHNSLTAAAFKEFPELREIMDFAESTLYGAGCAGVALSGSGSAIFGVFDEKNRATEAVAQVNRESGLRAFAVESFLMHKSD